MFMLILKIGLVLLALLVLYVAYDLLKPSRLRQIRAGMKKMKEGDEPRPPQTGK